MSWGRFGGAVARRQGFGGGWGGWRKTAKRAGARGGASMRLHYADQARKQRPPSKREVLEGSGLCSDVV
jgi:hypothetical protein